jgi:hypothetical protein
MVGILTYRRLFIILAAIILLGSASIAQALPSTPSVAGFTNLTTTEQDPAAVIDSDVSFSNGHTYSDGYLLFTLSGSTAYDQLVLSSDPDPNVSGAISVSGDDVYLGNGSGTDRIGSIDVTENGVNGQSLKILFSSPLTNAGFETGDTTGWTSYQQNYGTSLNGQSIPYVYSGGSGTGTVTLGTDSGGTSYNITVQTTEKSSGTYALRLYSSGSITFINPSGLSGQQPDGYGSLHGPYILSSEFTAENGDQLYVDWSAVNGGDWYEVFGYLVGAGADSTFGTGDDTRTKLFSQRGDTQAWTTTNATISSSGTYKFEFVCGTYDASGGKAVGASLYVDNIRIVSSTAVTDAVVTAIAQLVTFENTSDDPPTSGRTLTVEAQAQDGSTGSDTATITITPVNDDPTNIALSAAEIDVTAGINGVVATISTTDSDDTSFTYTLVTGPGDTDNGLFNINGTQLRANDADMAVGSYSIRLKTDDGNGGIFEKSFTLTVLDSDSDGIPDGIEGVGDTDSDGTPDYLDTDSDGDGIQDVVEGNVDTDSDGTPDFLDFEADGDGVDDEVENGAPNNGDGNDDGVADRLQSRVTSLVTYNAAYYVTIESPVGTTLTNVLAADNPSPGDMPPGSEFTYDLFDFTINGIGAGGATELKLYLPAGANPVTYYKYGQTPDDSTNHWYEFIYNGVIGAQIEDNVITLYFVDAEKGDDVLTQDSMVVDLGGPLFSESGSDRTYDFGPASGGCFINSLKPKTSPSNAAVKIIAGLGLLFAFLLFMLCRISRPIVAIFLLAVCLTIGMQGTADADNSTKNPSASESPFYLSAGVGVAHIYKSIDASYLGSNYRLDVDNNIYPIFRFGYHLSKMLALELGFHWDIYSGTIDKLETGGSNDLKGYTFFFGPVYTGKPIQCKFFGPLRPMVHVNLGYTKLHDDLNYPIDRFEPAFGVDIAVGVQRKNIDLRLGYRYFKLDRDRTINGVDTSAISDELDLSGVFLEISYRFSLPGN